jgi:pimeloyl-ACP methyl ester carboxylesterase
VVVGSSMGGWLALLLARELRRRKKAGAPEETAPASLAAMVLIAPAVDFTEELWKRLPEDVRQKLEADGVWERPSDYSEEPYQITAGLIEDGRRHLLLGGLIETACYP